MVVNKQLQFLLIEFNDEIANRCNLLFAVSWNRLDLDHYRFAAQRRRPVGLPCAWHPAVNPGSIHGREEFVGQGGAVYLCVEKEDFFDLCEEIFLQHNTRSSFFYCRFALQITRCSRLSLTWSSFICPFQNTSLIKFSLQLLPLQSSSVMVI